MCGRNHNAQTQQGPPYRVMSERLPNRETLAIDRHADQPVPGPPEVGYRGMFELGVAVRAQDEEITWVEAHLWVEMMYFEIRLAVPLFESERTELTSPVVEFSEQNANSRGGVHLRGARSHPEAPVDVAGAANPEQCATILAAPTLAGAFLSGPTESLILGRLPNPSAQPEGFVGP